MSYRSTALLQNGRRLLACMEGRHAHKNPTQSSGGDKSDKDEHKGADRKKNSNASSKQQHGNQESKSAKENLQADLSRDPSKEGEGGAHSREAMKQNVRYGRSEKKDDGANPEGAKQG